MYVVNGVPDVNRFVKGHNIAPGPLQGFNFFKQLNLRIQGIFCIHRMQARTILLGPILINLYGS